MNNITKMERYVIITPVRDEEKYLGQTIECVLNQTVRPLEWVIVNDGSSDRTGEIIDQYSAQFSWIRAVHRVNRGFRKSGGGVVEAFYDGYRALQSKEWEFIVKLDGDLTFSTHYFEECFAHFYEEPRLGIGGGQIYHSLDRKLKLEENPRFHVRGATKIYRRTCWDEIGGLWVAPGWDTIDEVKANMLGWTTGAFPELQLIHHRITGSADGFVRDRVKHGLACYISGYHPLFLAASCVRRLVRPPYVVGSFAVLFGFLKGYWRNVARVDDSKLISYLRNQQLRRLCGLETIWK
ncbi:glycosyltransferase involved in cell wall biosynthesis [Edaphobacter lichenicola]|uniref:Glycosyltransferase involved in cell wall biosynthesis n=2 Tax=Tunturiibacter gelidiferens TaxID=3069689 RepID=A0A9X0QGS8_9BACT|nr:glycosyltransferase involved in cell wall biosynthesis [Edaphobacter lichenicola]